MNTTIREIDVHALYQLLDTRDRLQILDVRPAEAFQAGHVEGRRAAHLVNVPYAAFTADEGGAVGSLPFDREQELVVVCARGRTSRLATELLQRHGFRVSSMTGGMQAWGDFYVMHEVVPSTPDLTIVQFNRPGKASLSYLVASAGEGIVIDANRHIEPYVEEARRRGITIRHVMDTHVHADYISGGALLAEQTGATYHLSGVCGYQGPLAVDGKPGAIRIGTLDLLKLATPGHTPGSTSLLVDGRFLLTGDTLFVGSVGRPDLGGEVVPWARQLYRTLHVELAALADEVVILPAHYADPSEMADSGVVSGTLGELRRTNEGMQARSEEEFIAFIERNMRPSPESYARIRQINLAALTVDAEELEDLDRGKNQCAASQGLACPTMLAARSGATAPGV